MEPPDTIPNSEVKRCNADGSVGLPHVRVGHRQVIKYESKLNKIKTEEPQFKNWGFCFLQIGIPEKIFQNPIYFLPMSFVSFPFLLF